MKLFAYFWMESAAEVIRSLREEGYLSSNRVSTVQHPCQWSDPGRTAELSWRFLRSCACHCGTAEHRSAMLEFMGKYDFRLMVSLDGPRKINDKNRVFVNGEGTYQKVMERLNHIYRNYPELKLRLDNGADLFGGISSDLRQQSLFFLRKLLVLFQLLVVVPEATENSNAFPVSPVAAWSARNGRDRRL